MKKADSKSRVMVAIMALGGTVVYNEMNEFWEEPVVMNQDGGGGTPLLNERHTCATKIKAPHERHVLTTYPANKHLANFWTQVAAASKAKKSGIAAPSLADVRKHGGGQ